MRTRGLVLALLTACSFTSCEAAGDGTRTGALTNADAPARTPKVLLIGVDGLRPDQLAAADAPRMQALAAEGLSFPAATNTWRPDAPSNGHSAPNWAALLTGRLPAATGLRVNADLERPDDPARHVDDRPAAVDAVRTVFWHAKQHDATLRTAVFNTWGGIGLDPGTILWTSTAVIDAHLHPRGDGSSAERDVETTAAAADLLASVGPALTFVHLSQVDAAGHAFTYEAPETRAAIAGIDAHVGQLLDALQARPSRATERWLVILTADHGGPDDGTNHADNADARTRHIPLLLWGDDLPPRAPDTDGHLVDVAPTILQWLGTVNESIPFDGRLLLDFDGY